MSEIDVPDDMNDSPVVDEIIPPGSPWGIKLNANQRMRLIDLEGRQAVDFLCYRADDPSERYHAPNTIKMSNNIFVAKGSGLYSNHSRSLMTVVEDTCGRHDTIAGCCSRESNIALYGEPGNGNCRDNFLAALKPFGLGLRDIVPNINFFMYTPVEEDGLAQIATGVSSPGDYVELRADMDVIVAMSNCPQMLNPANDFNPTPVRVTVWD